MLNFRKSMRMPTSEEALPGRDQPIPTASHHFISGRALHGPYPDGMKKALFGLGCFWGAERRFWQAPGVYVTAAGYSAGITPNPTYEETCTGLTGHNEVVLVVYDPHVTDYAALLKLFFESHDPTQGMRQGNDIGTTYRSGIYYFDETEKEEAEAARSAYQAVLSKAGYGAITTEIEPASVFYFAEDYHQQYLAKNPNGYCGLGGTGVSCPIGLHVAAE